MLAIIDRKAGIQIGDQDVFVSAAGGARVVERASDLGIALAIVSSFRDRPIAPRVVAFGELGLAGELRAVTRPGERLREAAKLGYDRCVLPMAGSERLERVDGIDCQFASTLSETLEVVLG